MVHSDWDSKWHRPKKEESACTYGVILTRLIISSTSLIRLKSNLFLSRLL